MYQVSICRYTNVINIFNLMNDNNGYNVKGYSNKWSNHIVIKQIKKPRLLTFSANNTIHLNNINKDECEEVDRNYLSILISNLQKAIRRNLPNTALITAKKLLQIYDGSIVLLRRLCIIIVEDKLLNLDLILRHYKVLVWIMATEQGYDNWQYWLFGLIRTICSFNHMEINHDVNIKTWYTNEYSNYFIIRSFFGGMKGDIRLLENVAKYINNIDIDESKQIIIEPISITKYIDRVCMLTSAIDFHCMPSMIENIMNRYELYSYEEVKHTIWIFSSSLRHDIQKKEGNLILKTIGRYIKNYQKYIIKNI